jgi:hypothetical protein
VQKGRNISPRAATRVLTSQRAQSAQKDKVERDFSNVNVCIRAKDSSLYDLENVNRAAHMTSSLQYTQDQEWLLPSPLTCIRCSRGSKSQNTHQHWRVGNPTHAGKAAFKNKIFSWCVGPRRKRTQGQAPFQKCVSALYNLRPQEDKCHSLATADGPRPRV